MWNDTLRESVDIIMSRCFPNESISMMAVTATGQTTAWVSLPDRPWLSPGADRLSCCCFSLLPSISFLQGSLKTNFPWCLLLQSQSDQWKPILIDNVLRMLDGNQSRTCVEMTSVVSQIPWREVWRRTGVKPILELSQPNGHNALWTIASPTVLLQFVDAWKQALPSGVIEQPRPTDCVPSSPSPCYKASKLSQSNCSAARSVPWSPKQHRGHTPRYNLHALDVWSTISSPRQSY